jgi:hypothetical protein
MKNTHGIERKKLIKIDNKKNSKPNSKTSKRILSLYRINEEK